jgi:hypothetical protein
MAAIFVACKNDHDEPVYTIYDEPAVVEQAGEQPVIRTAYGNYAVPALAGLTVNPGDLLWVAFTVDMNNQPSRELLTAQNFRYKAIDSTTVTIPANTAGFEAALADAYSDSIDAAIMYNTCIDRMLFFAFTQTATGDRTFEYELVCNPDLETGSGNIPTLYIRSRALTAVAPQQESSSARKTVFGFRMNEYISYYREKISASGPVKFNLKYKIGTDRDGKDVYREFKSNPLSWNIK